MDIKIHFFKALPQQNIKVHPIPDGSCCLAAWVVSKSGLVTTNDRPKPKLQNERASTHCDV